jgi:hypothetical protein
MPERCPKWVQSPFTFYVILAPERNRRPRLGKDDILEKLFMLLITVPCLAGFATASEPVLGDDLHG